MLHCGLVSLYDIARGKHKQQLCAKKLSTKPLLLWHFMELVHVNLSTFYSPVCYYHFSYSQSSLIVMICIYVKVIYVFMFLTLIHAFMMYKSRRLGLEFGFIPCPYCVDNRVHIFCTFVVIHFVSELSVCIYFKKQFHCNFLNIFLFQLLFAATVA